MRFKQPLIDLEVWERDLAVLECEVPEDSVPITWYLEDRRLQPGAKYGMEEWGTKRRLTIRDIGVDDDGIYLCEMPDGGRSIAEVAVNWTEIEGTAYALLKGVHRAECPLTVITPGTHPGVSVISICSASLSGNEQYTHSPISLDLNINQSHRCI